jgi:hypothetical protein
VTLPFDFRRCPCLVDHLVCFETRQWRCPKRDVAVNFHRYAPATERDDRTEDRVVGRSDKEFNSGIGHRCDEGGPRASLLRNSFEWRRELGICRCELTFLGTVVFSLREAGVESAVVAAKHSDDENQADPGIVDERFGRVDKAGGIGVSSAGDIEPKSQRTASIPAARSSTCLTMAEPRWCWRGWSG